MGSLAGSGLWSSVRLQAGRQLGLQPSDSLTGWWGRGVASKEAPSQGWQGDAECWREASAFCHMALSTGYLSGCRAGSPRDHKAKTTVSFMAWLQKSHCHFCHILSVILASLIQ